MKNEKKHAGPALEAEGLVQRLNASRPWAGVKTAAAATLITVGYFGVIAVLMSPAFHLA